MLLCGCCTEAMAEASRRQIESEVAATKSVDVLPSATAAGTESQPTAAGAGDGEDADGDGADGGVETATRVVPAAPLPGPVMPPGMMPPHMIPGIKTEVQNKV